MLFRKLRLERECLRRRLNTTPNEADVGVVPAPGVAPEESGVGAIARWFNHFPEPHMTGLSAGQGPNGFFQPSHNLFRRLLGHFDCGLRILDLGCGYGEDAVVLSGDSNQVWGIDIAQQRVAAAEATVAKAKRSDRVFISKMDVHNMQFEDAFFDLIVANSFLMWVNKARAVAECHRVLKPGGRAVFSCETMAENPFLKLHRYRPSMRARENLVSRVTPEEVKELSARFSSTVWERFYLLSPMFYPLALYMPKSKAVHGLIKGMQSLDRVILRRYQKLRRYAWLSVIEFRK